VWNDHGNGEGAKQHGKNKRLFHSLNFNPFRGFPVGGIRRLCQMVNRAARVAATVRRNEKRSETFLIGGRLLL
jgi:hypothetical protein